MTERNAVITGIGMLSPLGSDIDEVWQALLEGKNGIRRLEEVDESLCGYGIHLCGHVVDFDIRKLGVPLKMINQMNSASKMLVYAGLTALKKAKISFPEETSKLNIGLIVGTGVSVIDNYGDIPYEKRNPRWFFETYPNMLLSYLSNITGIKKYTNTIVTACTSGTYAIGMAAQLIKSGQFDAVIAGAVDNKLSFPFFSGFSRLNMSTKTGDPETSMRPFDKDRSGFVPSNGACMVVLESMQHAMQRKVKPIASICGFGTAMSTASLIDADHVGVYNSMQMAIKDAGISADQIDYINAHGTSTVSNDREESTAIKKLFQNHSYEIPVNSTKSMIGHSFAASGAIGIAVCAKSIEAQKIHMTRNFQKGDEFCDLDYVKDKSKDCTIRYCLSNSSGLGGYNASVVLSRPDIGY